MDDLIGAPVWLVVALAVAGVIAGHLTIRYLKASKVPQATTVP
ncbi:hypothetical protein ACIBL3_41045 [Kribbella sp. NPDC050124]